MTNIVFITDSHAHPDHDNSRADLLGKFLLDLRPEVVIHGGDSADMPSLCSYDKGKRVFQGRNYRKDINSHLDFQDRMWHPWKKSKKKLPLRVFLEGNHENRIKKAINISPELDGAISFSDLKLEDYYNEVIEYTGSTPSVYSCNDVNFGHYFVSGVMGRPIGGEHHGYSLITKTFGSSVCGHSHLLDYSVRTDNAGRKLMGLVGGCFQDYEADWAGECNKLWWRGLTILHNTDNGSFDPEFVSLQRLCKEYTYNQGSE